MRIAVSIVVTIYNKEEYLDQCISSLENQTLKDIEIILVNDGSTDRSAEICNAHRQNDDRIIVIDKANEGVVKARISGAKEAKGKYLLIMDADDWVESDYVGNLYDTAIDNNADVVISGYTERKGSDYTQVEMTIPTGTYEGQAISSCILSKMIYDGTYFHAGINPSLWNKLFKREILVRHLENVDQRLSMGEDGAATYPALANCKRIEIDNSNKSYNYRITQGSLSKKYDPDFFRNAGILLYVFKTNLNAVSQYNFDTQIDYYAVFIISLGVTQEIHSKEILSARRKAKHMRENLRFFSREEMRRLAGLKGLPEREKRMLSYLAEENYYGLVVKEFKSTMVYRMKSAMRRRGCT